MAFHRITVTINGSSETADVPSNMTLLTMLREKLALTGSKNGCAAGECGACTVLWNGEPVNSCLVLAVECDGTEIVTVEGLSASRDHHLDPVQQTLIEAGGVQCGFCTPGILISAHALLERNPHPSEYEIRDALVGNLCRCTGYVRIIEAVKLASENWDADERRFYFYQNESSILSGTKWSRRMQFMLHIPACILRLRSKQSCSAQNACFLSFIREHLRGSASH